MTSITRFLVVIIIAIFTLVTFSAAIRGYKESMLQATTLFDQDLEALAATLSVMRHDSALVPVPNQSHFAFQVWQDEQLVSRTENTTQTAIAAFQGRFTEQNFSGKRWRVLAHHNPEKQQWILVAQSIADRFQVAEQLIIVSMQPLVISIPIIAILVLLLVKAGLRPLKNLSNLLDKKASDDFSQVDVGTTPVELNQVIKTLNSLLNRLGAAFNRERRFASDAAHELRTPLSVLKISLHNLEQALKEANLNLQQTQALEQGVERMGHVIEQILMLNRTNPETLQLRFKPVNLTAVLRQQVGDIYPRLAQKNQHVSVHGDEWKVIGDESALSILVFNLISNCNKYIPDNAEIRLSIMQTTDTVRLVVEDSGPGIAEPEREKVFQRFYRVGGDQHTSNTEGCGLGLAIVKQIADLHHAAITLNRSQTLGGLQVILDFPIPKEDAA
ncbi:sensor histidine kinase [Alteromonas sp. a30]|uniref:sensor histidine kinase n=1 Tax=Alteromonas sp. a30 TaxID=2730917 RepID=UPI002282AC44|nr:ATP-binding protein [Alteromonas sp. a30]MCY7295546.1 two-component sensor histidine kinase [Alteromonas sp. a30]